MTPEQFVYWLQGFVEIREAEQVGLTKREWDIIKDHLQTVFHKVTPQRDLIGSDPYRPHITPLEITPNGTGTPPWLDPNRPQIIC